MDLEGTPALAVVFDLWLLTSFPVSGLYVPSPKSLCLLVLRVKALHINLRKSTKDPCFFNYKIHTFFFFVFQCIWNWDVSYQWWRHTVSTSQEADITVCALCELGCHSWWYNWRQTALDVSGHKLVKNSLWKKHESWLLSDSLHWQLPVRSGKHQH